ncbi:MAG: NYN domain-containing protein, partial [Candidatus Giovannonibacteria bacterium]|nr:NYN domain-containing protein [Candidatus Giovannonibacteria bacterium]
MTNFSDQPAGLAGIYSDGEKYISSKRASALTGYAKDYIGQLCRLGKIKCQRSGRDWLVSEQSIFNYKEGIALNNNLNRNIPSYDAQTIEPSRQIHAISRESRLNELGIKNLTIIFEAILVFGLVILNPAGALTAFHKASDIAENILNSTHVLNSSAFAALPSLPFTWEDSRLAVLDIKNRFLENLFLWKDYLASFGGDLKIIALDFLSIKPEIVDLPAGQAGAPSPQPQEGSKIITFASSTPLSSSLPLTKGEGQGVGVKEIRTVVERVLSGLPAGKAGITQADLDQKLSQFNQIILSQVQLSLSALEKRLPSNQVQNPVMFLTTSIPGSYSSSPPQTGSGVSASFGDFSNGISTGGNLTASGNITLGKDNKSAEITSSTWKITSAGAASGLTSLSTDSLSVTSLNASSLSAGTITGDPTFSGNLIFSGNSTTTIFSSAINAFSFATSTTAVPFLSFDTANYRIGIGTTTPSETFSVNGNGIFSGSLNVGGFLIANSNGITVNGTTTSSNQLVATFSPVIAHTFGAWAIGASGSAVTNASMVINPSSAVADSDLFGAAVNDSVKFLIDAEGDVFANSITLTGGSSLATTSINTLTIENNATFGDAITDQVVFVSGLLSFNNFATTTIASSTPSGAGINAFSFATSTTAVPMLSFDTTNSRIGILTTAPTNRFDIGSGQFVINQGGNVGIGTTTPWGLLSINPNGIAGPAFVVGSSTQCVTGDTKLKRRRRRRKKNSKGEWEEEDEFEDTRIDEIKEGDEILTLDDKTGKLKVSRVRKLMHMGRKPIIELETALGRKIRTTANHPYFVRAKSALTDRKPKLGIFYDNSNMFYAQKEAGWKIDFKKLKRELSGSFDIRFINLYSAVPGKGDPARESTLRYLDLVKQDVVLKTKPLKYIRTVLEIDGEIKEEIKKKGDVDVEITLDVVRNIADLDAIMIVSGDSDYLPLRDYIVKENNKKAVFGGFRDNMAWELTTGSKYLFFDNFKNLLVFGGEKTTPEPKLGVVLLSLLYSRPPSLSSGGVWTKVSGLKTGQGIAVLGKNGKPVWDKIESMRELPEEDVYDIEVEGTHNFIGNDIVAHNTYLTVTNGGRVGIGTTSPATQLSIKSSSAATPALSLESAASPSSDYFQIRSSGASGGDILTVDSSGR